MRAGRRTAFLLLSSLGAFAACGTTEETEEAGPPAGERVEVAITAAEGGTVQLSGMTLEIPGGSLGADTTITAESQAPSGSLPAQETLVGLLVDFGPDNTTFDPPATLSLPLPSAPVAGQSAVVSYLDGNGAWVDLETMVHGDMVMAPVAHFTSFIVRFVGGGPVDCAFTPCEGDPTGTWTLDGACVNNDNPIGDSCPDAVFEAVLGGSGSIDLRADGTYTVVLNITGTFEVAVPPACLADRTACSELGPDLSDATCTGDVATGCSCAGTMDAHPTNESGSWSQSGSTITTDDDEGQVDPNPVSICADATTLKVRTPEGQLIVFSR